MSEAYVSEFSKASKLDAAAPYVPESVLEQIDRAAVSSKVGSILRGFKRKPT